MHGLDERRHCVVQSEAWKNAYEQTYIIYDVRSILQSLFPTTQKEPPWRRRPTTETTAMQNARAAKFAA